MTIETINGQRVLTPDENMWLYNESQKVISNKVYLGKEADANEWSEITEERRQELEVLWSEDITNPDEATDEDYQNALKELGVEL